jgi:eukaryotic-like serine/threonine-protein kinase
MSKERSHLYEFGPFRVDPERRLLLRDNRPVPLQPKAFDTLLVLVRQSETVVLKDDLMKAVWPDTFVEESNLAQNIFVLRKTLGEAAGENRYIVTVPGRGYRFSERVREVTEQPADLVIETHSIQRMTIEESKPQRHWWVAALIVAMVAGVGGIFYMRSRQPKAGSEAGTSMGNSAARRTVAVLGFRNLSERPDKEWLSTALSEMVSTELAAGDKLRLISGEDVARTKRDLALADTGTFSKQTLAHMRRNMGSDLVVLGSYTALGGNSNGNIRLDLQVQNASAGETVAEVAATGTEDDLFSLVSQAGARLRESLGVEAVSPADAVSVRASLPETPEAARLYAEGLAKLRVVDDLAARDLLEQAVAADPKYPLSHAALAGAWSSLGYDAKARGEATKAFQLSDKLRHEERLAVEGRYRNFTLDYDKAIEVYRTLYTLYPDNLDYGLRLAAIQVGAGKSADAVTTLQSLQKLPPHLGADPRIDLGMASAVSSSDYPKALAADEQAIKKGKAIGARQLIARAYGSECALLIPLDKIEQAIAACQESQQLYAASGDRSGEGKEVNDLGYARIQQGNLVEAKRLWQEAAQIFREIGNEGGAAAVLANLAAEDYLEGNLAEAKKLLRDALPRYRKVEDNEGESLTLDNLAELLTDEADLRSAIEAYRQALELARRIDNKHAAGYALAGLGDPLLRQGNLAEARKSYEQSLALRTEIGEKQTAAESRTYLAELTIEEGDAADAEKSARDTLNEFHKERQLDDEVTAAAVLVEALLAQNKPADARAIVDGEAEAAGKDENLPVRMKFAIVSARALAASGRPDEAKITLSNLLKDETRRGFLAYQLETRLALAEIEFRTGHSGIARTQLAAVRHDAEAHGLGLLAHKAAQLQVPIPTKA